MILNVNSLNINIMAGLDGNIEPIYSLITSIAFIFLSFFQYKKSGKTKETIYLTLLSFFFLFSYFAIISVGLNY